MEAELNRRALCRCTGQNSPGGSDVPMECCRDQNFLKSWLSERESSSQPVSTATGWKTTGVQPCLDPGIPSGGKKSAISKERERNRISSVQFSSVTQSYPTLCDPMNCSMPGLPVHHHLPEFTQTHVHRVRDAIHPSHPLSSPSPPAPNPSQHQSLFQ